MLKVSILVAGGVALGVGAAALRAAAGVAGRQHQQLCGGRERTAAREARRRLGHRETPQVRHALPGHQTRHLPRYVVVRVKAESHPAYYAHCQGKIGSDSFTKWNLSQYF